MSNPPAWATALWKEHVVVAIFIDVDESEAAVTAAGIDHLGTRRQPEVQRFPARQPVPLGSWPHSVQDRTVGPLAEDDLATPIAVEIAESNRLSRSVRSRGKGLGPGLS